MRPGSDLESADSPDPIAGDPERMETASDNDSSISVDPGERRDRTLADIGVDAFVERVARRTAALIMTNLDGRFREIESILQSEIRSEPRRSTSNSSTFTVSAAASSRPTGARKPSQHPHLVAPQSPDVSHGDDTAATPDTILQSKRRTLDDLIAKYPSEWSRKHARIRAEADSLDDDSAISTYRKMINAFGQRVRDHVAKGKLKDEEHS